MNKEKLSAHFEAHAADRDQWVARNAYYHRQLAHQFALHISPGKSVLEIGSGLGQLLAALQPSRGVGVDLSPNMVRRAREKYPHLTFLIGDGETLTLDEKFDYVILSDVISYLHDVQDTLHRLQRVCHPRTRIIISSYNAAWQPILHLGEALGLKTRQPTVNWLGNADIANLLDLAGYEVIRHNSRVLLPVNLPLLAPLCNRWLVNLPVFRHLALVMMIVARPKPQPTTPPLHHSSTPVPHLSTTPPPPPTVSVIIPARNEAGNIEAALRRTPKMGAHTEIIFVEGNSSDNTEAEIKRVIAAHPEVDARLIPQGTGRGKGDAVRKGFAAATGEILMILDADLTVEPEELPKFYDALVSGHGEFVHGSRLVYPMDKQAMRFLNMLGNKFFSFAFSYLLEQRFKDTLCGTKVLYRSDYDQVAVNRAYFGDFDPFGDFDLIFGAAKLNLKIVEIPIHYRERTYGTTNISRFSHGWLLLRMCAFAMRKIKFV